MLPMPVVPTPVVVLEPAGASWRPKSRSIGDHLCSHGESRSYVMHPCLSVAERGTSHGLLLSPDFMRLATRQQVPSFSFASSRMENSTGNCRLIPSTRSARGCKDIRYQAHETFGMHGLYLKPVPHTPGGCLRKSLLHSAQN